MNQNLYYSVISVVEKLHRLIMEVFRVELDRLNIHDINNVQSFILHNIGTNKMTIGEISNRGYYLGSNVTYNLKQMIQNGYIIQEPSVKDKRSSYIQLSEKGLVLYKRFGEILDQHALNMNSNGVSEETLKQTLSNLQKLESFWSFVMSHNIRF